MKKFIVIMMLVVLCFVVMAAQSPQLYARRIFPIFDTTRSCSENQIGYNMLTHELYICKHTGWSLVGEGVSGTGGIESINGLSAATQTFVVGAAGNDFNILSSGSVHTFNFPTASATNRGLLASADWITFNNKQSALGFTPENIANKNSANGYAGLGSNTKIPIALLQEVLSVVDLTDYNSVSGTGTVSIKATISSPISGQVLQWDGSNWVNASVGGGGGENILTFNSPLVRTVDTITCPTCALTTINLSQFASTTSAQLAGIVSNETGTGSLVFNDSPTLVTPALGTPSSINLTNAIGLPVSTGISGFGTGIATFLSTPSSANLAAAITNETGTGVLVFGTSPTFTTGISVTAISNLTSNGFIKTSGGTGALSVDTNTYLTGNQTITLSGNVTGSGTTAITTTIANNSITGAMIALGSDAQGDIMFFNGTDWTRLAAGTSGNVLMTQGIGANPIWSAAGSGDVTLAGTQTFTGSKTFNATRLIIGTNAGAPAVVANSFYRDSVDGKLYIGKSDGTQWNEIFEAGISLVSLTSHVTGDLPFANFVQASAASKLVGRGSASGAGDFQEISLGTGLSMSGTTLSVSTSGNAYDISTQIDAKPAINLQVLRYVATRNISLASSGHRCSAATAATAQTDFTIAINGVSKGTLRFAASGTTCTIISGASDTLDAGEVLTITAPGSQDATLADIAFTLSASLP